VQIIPHRLSNGPSVSHQIDASGLVGNPFTQLGQGSTDGILQDLQQQPSHHHIAKGTTDGHLGDGTKTHHHC
jgi:hypothetical protein